MKPREFYLEIGAHLTISGIPLTNNPKQIHVREVVPIDWEKVWSDYDKLKRLGTVAQRGEQEVIQKLVEKQLAGEE